MADGKKASLAKDDTAQAPDDPVVDEALASAAAYRRVGQTFTAVLAAIPTVAVLSSLIRAPGDSGFEEGKLLAGLAAVAVSVGIAVALAVHIRSPVDIRDDDSDVRRFEMSRVLGARNPDYASLMTQIQRLVATTNLSPESKDALKAAVRIRQRVFQLVAADRMRERVTGVDTGVMFICALVFAVIGVFFLAIAPKPKQEETASVKLVSVTLSPSGKNTLGCNAQEFTGLQVSGGATDPVVVPFDTECTKGKLLALTVGEGEKLATKVEDVTPAGAVAP
jgi:hypothetical protein